MASLHHQMLHVPLKVTLQHHQILRLPQKVKCCASHKNHTTICDTNCMKRRSISPKFASATKRKSSTSVEHHQIIRLQRKITLQHHQILHLPPTVTLQYHQMLPATKSDAPISTKWCACTEIFTPVSENVARATKGHPETFAPVLVSEV